MEQLFVGVDLHKTQFTVCVMDGEVVLDNGTKYPLSREGLSAFISIMQSYQCPVDIAIESTGNARFFRDRMEEAGFRVTVVNTLRFKVVNQSTKKTDKNDAKTLCEFLSKQMLPQSHLCSKENESIRRILKSRTMMVQSCVALKNQAHAILLAHGVFTKTAQFQSKKQRTGILKTTKDKFLKKTLEVLFETLDNSEKEIKQLELHLKEVTKGNSTVKNLMTIPGIGIVNACTISAYTDDITRFETYKNYSAYCGLVPWVQSSNNSAYYGRITKRGPIELRNAMVQCTVGMLRMPDKTGDYRIIKQYHYLKENKSSGKAIIATARKLSRIIFTMIQNQTPFDSARLVKD